MTIKHSETWTDRDGVEHTITCKLEARSVSQSHPYGMGRATETLCELVDGSATFFVDDVETEGDTLHIDFHDFDVDAFVDSTFVEGVIQ